MHTLSLHDMTFLIIGAGQLVSARSLAGRDLALVIRMELEASKATKIINPILHDQDKLGFRSIIH